MYPDCCSRHGGTGLSDEVSGSFLCGMAGKQADPLPVGRAKGTTRRAIGAPLNIVVPIAADAITLADSDL